MPDRIGHPFSSFHGPVRGICPPVSGQWPSKARSQEAASHPLLRSSADGRAFDGHRPSTCGQRQRGHPPVVGGGWLRKARENVPTLPFSEKGSHPISHNFQPFGAKPSVISSAVEKSFPSFHGLSSARSSQIIIPRPSVESVLRPSGGRLLLLQVRHRTVAGRAVRCSRSAKIL